MALAEPDFAVEEILWRRYGDTDRLIDVQLSKGTLFPFIEAALKADDEDKLWELYLKSDTRLPFNEWKERVTNG